MVPSMRVLIVDDAADMRSWVSRALRARGTFDVVGEAENGAQAVALAGSVPHDVVVLDLGLPDLAGHEVLTRIRAVSPNSKVVVFSGADLKDSLGAIPRVEGYVVKSLGIRYLLDLLEGLGATAAEHATLKGLADMASVRRAREFVEVTLTRWQTGVDIDDALIVTSELVTNAITHARSSCELRLSVTAHALRIEAVDHGPGTPDLQIPSHKGDHGRGLHIIANLTTAWGIEIISGGKIVWADLPRST
jgi:CheY-like chemotaxis protein/anti-sigma regulatory factor (Ser/Thr protein kinase)